MLRLYPQHVSRMPTLESTGGDYRTRPLIVKSLIWTAPFDKCADVQ
jgi:hypothetical protein